MMQSPARQLDPVSAAWNTVASCDSYPQAQAAVDNLSMRGSRCRTSTSSARTCA